MMPYTVRPIDPLTPWPNRRRPDQHIKSLFSSSWTSTHDLLDRELSWLVRGARTWVLQMDVSESQIRRDGGVHARATPVSPAVRVSFNSDQGPLLYACDRYNTWQDNVRAIALSLEALRKVARYGVADSGEQYRGWQAISNRPNEMSREQAAEFIAHWSDQPGYATVTGADLLATPTLIREIYRQAAKRAHPDVTGDDGDTMARLNAARDLLLNGARSG